MGGTRGEANGGSGGGGEPAMPPWASARVFDIERACLRRGVTGCSCSGAPCACAAAANGKGNAPPGAMVPEGGTAERGVGGVGSSRRCVGDGPDPETEVVRMGSGGLSCPRERTETFDAKVWYCEGSAGTGGTSHSSLEPRSEPAPGLPP